MEIFSALKFTKFQYFNLPNWQNGKYVNMFLICHG
jgi:hypothetical protein